MFRVKMGEFKCQNDFCSALTAVLPVVHSRSSTLRAGLWLRPPVSIYRYSGAGYAEQDAIAWWKTICQELHYLIEGQKVDPRAIAAIGIDGISWVCLPVDQKGVPLRKAMIWLDRRAEKQAAWLRQTLGEQELIQLSGNPVDPAYITPKILWLRENEPEVYARTAKFLQSNAFLVYKLTGVLSQDYSQAYGFHFLRWPKGYG